MDDKQRPAWYIAPLPDLISGFRLGLAAAFPLLSPAWRLPVVIAAGLSDGLDGLLARRFGAMTFAGALLDAIADKAFTLSALITLSAHGEIQWWQVLLVLVRDIAVAVVAVTIVKRRQWSSFRRLVAGAAGKVTTVALFAWLIAVLAGWPDAVTLALFVLTAVASVFTASQYLWRFAQALHE